MAVVEIAKIQVRRGDARYTGMPTLDTGEFGWAIAGTDPDKITPELYIGNQLNDGATLAGNTRVLTELDIPNIFQASVTTSTYTYTGNKSLTTNVTVYTGFGNSDVVRTVQKKLDESVSIMDFGIISGATTVVTTAGLQRALDQLYLNSDKTNPVARVKLKIPAGTYQVTATIYVPPYASIVGEGKDKTIIEYTGDAGKAVFQFVDLTSTPGAPVMVANFNSNTSPRYIEMSGMTIQYGSTVLPDTAYPLLRADAAVDTIIDDVKFKGNYFDSGNPSYMSGLNKNHVGIDIRGTGAITSKNLRITNCLFETLSYGIKSNYDIEDTVIDNNKFENLYRGIVYGEELAAAQQTGPKRSRITRNVFSIISKEAVYITTGTYINVNTDHILSQNFYTNVGNNSSKVSPGNGDVNPTTATSIIRFDSYGNVSENDTFSRFININNTTTQSLFILPINGHASIIDNKVKVLSLASGTASGTFLKLAKAPLITNVKIQYHFTGPGISRWGDLYVVVAQDIVADITDNYKFSGGDGNLVFSAALDNTPNSAGYPSNTIRITYSGNSANGQITYQINQYY
jgi:hypothetical protein